MENRGLKIFIIGALTLSSCTKLFPFRDLMVEEAKTLIPTAMGGVATFALLMGTLKFFEAVDTCPVLDQEVIRGEGGSEIRIIGESAFQRFVDTIGRPFVNRLWRGHRPPHINDCINDQVVGLIVLSIFYLTIGGAIAEKASRKLNNFK